MSRYQKCHSLVLALHHVRQQRKKSVGGEEMQSESLATVSQPNLTQPGDESTPVSSTEHSEKAEERLAQKKLLMFFNTTDLPETKLVLGIHEALRRSATSASEKKQGALERKQGHIKVLCNTEGGFAELLSDSDLDVEHFKCRSRLDFSAVRRLRKLLTTERYDLIHAYTSRALSISLLAIVGLKHKPKIIAYRGAIGNVERYDPLSWLTYRRSNVTAINCVSHAVKNYLEGVGIPRSKLVTIYKGHEAQWYDSRSCESLRQLLGLDESAILVVAAANMRRVKGVDLLVRAAQLCSLPSTVHFVLIGEVRDPLITQLAKDPRIASNIHFLGSRTDAPWIVRGADLVVMPSRDREGLPKTVIEAMIQGVPPIVTNVGGMPELVRHMREGLVIPSEDVDTLVYSIEKLCGDPELRKSLGTAARSKILRDFNSTATIQETLDLYDWALRSNTGTTPGSE